MAYTQTSYTGRLPYGYWFDPATREEHLFDRGYRCIASRSVDRPEVVTLHGSRRHILCPVELWFYSDSCSPGSSVAAVTRCECILSHFTLGRDVRRFVKPEHASKRPGTDGSYLPARPRHRSVAEARLIG
jgi:hypothetical protein